LVQTDEERKAKTKEYYQRPEVKAKQKEYYQRPEVKAKQKESTKKYRKSSKGKIKAKEYSQRPEVKAKAKEYSQRPEVKAKAKEYSQRPEVKARTKVRLKEYRKTPEVKAKQKESKKKYLKSSKGKIKVKEYNSRPEVKAKVKEYNSRNKKRYAKPRQDRRMQVLQIYSKRLSNSNVPCCNCCNKNSHSDFLAIDHIAGRKQMDSEPELVKIGYSSKLFNHQLIKWIIENDFPSGFQILCSNCNFAKGLEKNNNQCPHERK
jgi:hypothetical protein